VLEALPVAVVQPPFDIGEVARSLHRQLRA
jgi:hypothetical protein